MSWRKVSSWFVTNAGQKFSFYVASTAVIGAFCIRYVPNAILVDNYVDFWRLYKRGFSVPVSKELSDRFKKAMEFAEVPEVDLHLYEPFMANGFDIFHVGTNFSKFGCRIGLPVNFLYSNVDTIEKSSIKIKGESVIWELPEAQSFLESVVLSEKAQIFAMAREIKMTQNYKIIADSLYGPLAIASTYFLGRNINIKFNYYAKPLAIRMVLYGLTSILGFAYYCMLKDATQTQYEKDVDEALKAKDPILEEGGLEFYSKTLQRNIALRKLMHTDGPAAYTILGNDVYWLRQRHVPVMHRKMFFENKEPDDNLVN